MQKLQCGLLSPPKTPPVLIWFCSTKKGGIFRKWGLEKQSSVKQRRIKILSRQPSEMSQTQVSVHLVAVYTHSRGNAPKAARITQGTSQAEVSNGHIIEIEN